MIVNRLVSAAAGLALLLAAHAPVCAQAGAQVAVTCRNPASGFAWQIRIDFGRATVDDNPATISAAAIAWHDAHDGGNYTLDRASGQLTVIVASSTGGYFLHDTCKLPT